MCLAYVRHTRLWIGLLKQSFSKHTLSNSLSHLSPQPGFSLRHQGPGSDISSSLELVRWLLLNSPMPLKSFSSHSPSDHTQQPFLTSLIKITCENDQIHYNLRIKHLSNTEHKLSSGGVMPLCEQQSIDIVCV